MTNVVNNNYIINTSSNDNGDIENDNIDNTELHRSLEQLLQQFTKYTPISYPLSLSSHRTTSNNDNDKENEKTLQQRQTMHVFNSMICDFLLTYHPDDNDNNNHRVYDFNQLPSLSTSSLELHDIGKNDTDMNENAINSVCVTGRSQRRRKNRLTQLNYSPVPLDFDEQANDIADMNTNQGIDNDFGIGLQETITENLCSDTETERTSMNNYSSPRSSSSSISFIQRISSKRSSRISIDVEAPEEAQDKENENKDDEHDEILIDLCEEDEEDLLSTETNSNTQNSSCNHISSEAKVDETEKEDAVVHEDEDENAIIILESENEDLGVDQSIDENENVDYDEFPTLVDDYDDFQIRSVKPRRLVLCSDSENSLNIESENEDFEPTIPSFSLSPFLQGQSSSRMLMLSLPSVTNTISDIAAQLESLDLEEETFEPNSGNKMYEDDRTITSFKQLSNHKTDADSDDGECEYGEILNQIRPSDTRKSNNAAISPVEADVEEDPTDGELSEEVEEDDEQVDLTFSSESNEDSSDPEYDYTFTPMSTNTSNNTQTPSKQNRPPFERKTFQTPISIRTAINSLCSANINTEERITARNRDRLSREIYTRLNEVVFDSSLPVDMQIIWTKRLQTTAGYCSLQRRRIPITSDANQQHSQCRTALIKLASHILLSYSQLETTLSHEMCHAAQWIIDGNIKPPHGKIFQKYATKVSSLYPHLRITTCHSYEIQYKFRWQCNDCSTIIGRQSRTINICTHRCRCGGSLTELGQFDSQGTPIVSRTPRLNEFAQYVKENYSALKQKSLHSNMAHKEIMKMLSVEYSAKKVSKNKIVKRISSSDLSSSSNTSLIDNLEDQLNHFHINL